MINSLMLIGLAGLIQAVPLDTAQLDIRELNGVGLTPAMGWNNYNAGLGKNTLSKNTFQTINNVQAQLEHPRLLQLKLSSALA
jgi:hypothetical protein